MLAGIREILLISTPEDLPRFQDLLEDGGQFGVQISYAVQPKPEGLAQALLIGEDFLQNQPCAMVLGDNIFYAPTLAEAMNRIGGKFNCGEGGEDPERFGVVEFDSDYRVLSVEEKPRKPKSNYCITGLYFYDGQAAEMAKQVRPSRRGELEITDLNRLYLEQGRLQVQVLGRGFAWMDTGTVESLMQAATFVEAVQNRQGVVISAPEEIAYQAKWIDREMLLEAAEKYQHSPYGEHLSRVAEDRFFY